MTFKQLQQQNMVLREALQRVWDEDECGYLTVTGSEKECVKCGAMLDKGLQHSDDCTQGFIETALSTPPLDQKWVRREVADELYKEAKEAQAAFARHEWNAPKLEHALAAYENEITKGQP